VIRNDVSDPDAVGRSRGLIGVGRGRARSGTRSPVPATAHPGALARASCPTLPRWSATVEAFAAVLSSMARDAAIHG
jgi:hypothetical protein